MWAFGGIALYWPGSFGSFRSEATRYGAMQSCCTQTSPLLQSVSA